MNRKLRRLLGMGLPILAIMVFFLLLIFSLLHLATTQQTIRLQAPHNMLRVISQSQRASLELSTAVARHTTGVTDAATLQQRYNVLLSHLSLLQQSTQVPAISTFGFADDLQYLHSQLRLIQSRIETLQPYDVRDANAIGMLLNQYNTLLTRAATKVMVSEWNTLDTKLDTGHKQIQQISISLIGILLAGTILILYFLIASRAARRNTRLLNKEKAFSQHIIGSSSEGIVAVDLDGQCTIWSKTAETLFRRPAQYVIGHELGTIVAFFQVNRIQQAIGESLRGQPAVLLDQPYFVDKHTTPRYLDVRCLSLRDSNGIIGAILLISDVTERLVAQRELALHRDHLEDLIRARTQELDAALEREKVTADLYRNFAAMISHQFCTPLAIVDSVLQRLIRRSNKMTAKEICEHGERARTAITRMTGLIESTPDTARIDAGQVSSRSQSCNIRKLAADACARQRDNTPDQSITMIAPKHGISPAWCDPAHVDHILANLLSNACKYAQNGTPIIVRLDATDTYVECAVVNHGVLPAVADTDALFERYYRGINTQNQPGIGIGLYVARALARLQGGDVRLGSVEADTITFLLRLPRTAAIGQKDLPPIEEPV